MHFLQLKKNPREIDCWGKVTCKSSPDTERFFKVNEKWFQQTKTLSNKNKKYRAVTSRQKSS